MKKVLPFLLSLFIGCGLSAQSDLTLYNFNAIPQSLHVNPATPQQTKIWVGLPVLSGFHFHYHNNGFALIDLLETGTDFRENKNKLIRSLDGNSQLSINQNYELLGVGFKVGKGFLTVGAYQNIDYRMDYPADILRFFNDGNTSGNLGGDTALSTQFNLNTFDFETVVRTNTYIGYQHKLMDDKLVIGGRVKYIIGQQNAHVNRIKAEIRTNDTSFTVNSDILVRTAGISGFADGNDFDLLASTFPSNTGIGFDIGVYYELNDKFNFSLSVLDIGSINWSSNTRDYVSKGEYTFNGIEVDYSEENPGSGTEYILDSITEAFDFQEVDGASYSRPLVTRFFVGANYQFNDKHAIGLLYHARKWNQDFFHDYSVNYQARLSRAFQFTASYSIINGTANNLGAGFEVKLGPVQLYMISDNVLHAVMYENLKTTNLRFGINLSFYGRKGKNKLPEESEGVRLVQPQANNQ